MVFRLFEEDRIVANVGVMDDLQDLRPHGGVKSIVLGDRSRFEGDDLTHSFHRFLPSLVTLASPSQAVSRNIPDLRYSHAGPARPQRTQSTEGL